MKEPFYRCSGCGHDFRVTAGTLFADTHKPLRVWFEAIWHMTNQKNGVSALGLQRALGLGSYRTAWNWLHKLRRAMVRPGRDRLAGVVEVDEAFIGGAEPGKRGRGAAGKSLILVCAQVDGRKIGRIRLARIADALGRPRRGHATDGQIGDRSSNRRLEGLSGIGNAGYGTALCARAPIRTICAPRPSGGLPSQALVARHPPGSEPGRSSGLLSRRVHLSLQPPHIPIPRVVVLPTD